MVDGQGWAPTDPSTPRPRWIAAPFQGRNPQDAPPEKALLTLVPQNILTKFPDTCLAKIGVVSENGIYGHSRFCNTDFDDKLACLNLSGV
jgi:hypothetical protein